MTLVSSLKKSWKYTLTITMCWILLMILYILGNSYLSTTNVAPLMVLFTGREFSISITNLTLYPYQENPANKIFFLETSGRSRFNPRQWCAIESAARFSGLNEINVMVKSKYLDTSDNITRNIIRELKNVRFHQIEPEKDFVGTPLEDFYLAGGFENSKFPSTHLSDALRMAYIYKVHFR
jgi:hypothetical protein